MCTITIELVNEKAIQLIKELESLKLIRVTEELVDEENKRNWQRYKGAMSKEDIKSVEKQLSKLRSAWD